jgi:hypothetical protein
MHKHFLKGSTTASNSSARLSSVCIAVLACSLALPFVGGQTPTPAPDKKSTTASKGKSKPSDTVPDGPPMTLETVIRMLKGVKTGLMDQPRIIAFIRKRGLDFTATSENIGQLLTAGAGPELVDLITELNPPPPPAPPPPPPPPPPPVTGTLHFLCAPAECNIRIDGGPDKLTSGGKLSIGDLVYKQYTVDFRKEGYLPKAEKITVSSANSPEISVTLEVKPEIRAAWGKQLYTSAIQALGGAKGLAEFKPMTATGGASSWNEQGSQSEWTLKSVFSTDDVYELTNPASGTFSISCHDETCNPKGKGFRRKANGPEADALNTNLRQYNRYHLMALMRRIGGANQKLAANAAPAAGKESHLLVTSPDETYDITLDAAFLPVTVNYRSTDGLASAKITYAEYATFDATAKYPLLTSISLPGEKQHGIRVKYDSVVPSAR